MWKDEDIKDEHEMKVLKEAEELCNVFIVVFNTPVIMD